MAVSKFFVSDALVYAFRTLFTQMRLIISATLETIGIILIAMLVIVLSNMPLFNAIIQLRDTKGAADFSDLLKIAPQDVGITIGYYWIPLLLSSCLLLGLVAWILTAQISIALEIYEKGKSSVKIFFQKLYLVPKMAVTLILFVIPLFFGIFLFIIPGIIWWIRASLVFFVIVDQNAGIFEAFRKSFAITKSYFWPLFGWHLFCCFVNNLSVVCSFFIVFPLCMLSGAHIYCALRDNYKS